MESSSHIENQEEEEVASQNGVEADESQEQREGTDKDEATLPLLWVKISANIVRIRIQTLIKCSKLVLYTITRSP